MDALQLVVPAITGGLAGGIVTALIARSRQRQELTLHLLDHFFSIYLDLGEAKGLLKQPSQRDPDDLNKVRRIGDWLNLVAILYRQKAVDADLLKRAVLLRELENFHELVTVAKTQDAQHFGDVWNWWPDLHAIEYQKLH